MRRLASLTVLFSLIATIAAADYHHRVPVVRVLSPRLAETLRDAARESPTLRVLLQELEHTDVIVHVTGLPPSAWPGLARRRLAGAMRFVTATRTRRFLRITVDESLPRDTRAAMLAHELWHALEVAHAPHVVDGDSFAAHYRHIGHSTFGNRSCYDTKAAVAAGVKVLAELRRGDASR